MKVLIVLVSLLAFQTVVFCQTDVIPGDSLRYPNELKGFQLIQKWNLRNLIPGITTAEELKTVNELIGGDCKIHQSGRCQLDEDWDVSIHQSESRDGNLFDIQFYPRKRISFSKVKFPGQFDKGGMGIVHLTTINAENFIRYTDKYGLSYVIVDEETDDYYQKGDLFYIEYGIPEAESKEVRSEK